MGAHRAHRRRRHGRGRAAAARVAADGPGDARPATVWMGVPVGRGVAGGGAWRRLAGGRCRAGRSDCQPAGAAIVDGRRGRRSLLAVLPLLRPDRRRRHDSIGLLPRLGTVRRLPQGRLRAVEGLGAPLRLVQQPVLPEVHRVHAVGGRARGRASGARAATTMRSSSTAASIGQSPSRSTRRRRRRAWPARPATPSRRSRARWATAGSPSPIPRCTGSPRAASR